MLAQAFTGDLASQLRSEKPTWFGYIIKTEGVHNQWCDGQQHESDTVAVLLKVENNQVEKVNLRSRECDLELGGLPLVWLKDVTTEASLNYLKTLSLDGAVFAISQHQGTQATDILIEKARKAERAHEREQAVFWLAQRAGAKSAAAIVDAITNDPDTGVKKKAVFALSQLPADEGVPKLIEVARTQRNPEVRKQAFFWLGQTHDPRALAYIEDVLTK
jgi:HEAT repeat protein